MAIYSDRAAELSASTKPPWDRPLWPQENMLSCSGKFSRVTQVSQVVQFTVRDNSSSNSHCAGLRTSASGCAVHGQPPAQRRVQAHHCTSKSYRPISKSSRISELMVGVEPALQTRCFLHTSITPKHSVSADQLEVVTGQNDLTPLGLNWQEESAWPLNSSDAGRWASAPRTAWSNWCEKLQ